MTGTDRKEYNAIAGTFLLGAGGLGVFMSSQELIKYFATGYSYWFNDKYNIALYGFEAAMCYGALLFASLLFLVLGSYKLRRLFGK